MSIAPNSHSTKSELELNLNSRLAEVSILRQLNADNEYKLDDLQSRLTTMQMEIEIKERENMILQSTVDDLTKKLKTHEKLFPDFVSKKSMQSIESDRDPDNKLATIIKRKYSECELLKIELETSEMALHSKLKQIEVLQGREQEYRDQIKQLTQKVEDISVTKTELEAVHENVKNVYLSDLKTLSERNVTLQNEVMELRQINSESKIKISQLTSAASPLDPRNFDRQAFADSISNTQLMEENGLLKQKIRALSSRLQIAVKSYEILKNTQLIASSPAVPETVTKIKTKFVDIETVSSAGSSGEKKDYNGCRMLHKSKLKMEESAESFSKSEDNRSAITTSLQNIEEDEECDIIEKQDAPTGSAKETDAPEKSTKSMKTILRDILQKKTDSKHKQVLDQEIKKDAVASAVKNISYDVRRKENSAFNSIIKSSNRITVPTPIPKFKDLIASYETIKGGNTKQLAKHHQREIRQTGCDASNASVVKDNTVKFEQELAATEKFVNSLKDKFDCDKKSTESRIPVLIREKRSNKDRDLEKNKN